MLIIIGIIALGILVFVHELGHFLVAKWFGVGVLEFSIGFGKKLFSVVRGETLYSLRLIPLGGFVRMAGDDPALVYENKDQPSSAEAVLGSAQEQPYTPEQEKVLTDRSRWFLTQRFGPKAAIVVAGPLANILFALFAGVLSSWHYGYPDPQDLPIIGAVYPKSPAEIGGLKKLDTVKSVNGHLVDTFTALREQIIASNGQDVNLVIERKDQDNPVQLELVIKTSFDAKELNLLSGKEQKPTPSIGIMAYMPRKPVTFWEACTIAPQEVYATARMSLRSIYLLLSRSISSNNIGGPIFIFGQAAKAAGEGLADLIGFMIFLSVSLAVFNLLPVPVLDGGHLLFFTIEAIKGSPVSMRSQQMATQVGMALLFALMLFATSNDLLRMVHGS